MTSQDTVAADSIAGARRQLADQGWTIIHGAGFTDGVDVDLDTVRRIACHFGIPSSRDGGDVWPVRPLTSDTAETFSQRSGEALLHTDAAYRSVPEPRFGLFCVRPADDGGLSRLLTATDAIRDLDGDLADELRRSQWRWLPPRVFGGQPDGPRAVLRSDGAIRWRYDNLALTAEQRSLAAAFAEHIDTHPRLVQLPLPADSVLVCDNERVLHGRTTFTDRARYLLRVRMAER
jgi:alpha-ketoglutarate-dependent taurine dioxygenase